MRHESMALVTLTNRVLYDDGFKGGCVERKCAGLYPVPLNTKHPLTTPNLIQSFITALLVNISLQDISTISNLICLDQVDKFESDDRLLTASVRVDLKAYFRIGIMSD